MFRHHHHENANRGHRPSPPTSPGWWRWLAPILLAVVAVATACTADDDERPVTVQPGAPGEPGRVVAPGGAGDRAGLPHTDADVRFVHAMIAHHTQALELTSLVPGRAGRADLSLFADRIEISQVDEIALMEGWLEARGEAAGPAGHDQHGGAGGLMPGMLTGEQLTELAAATGADFDRLFLEFMIYHHEGALRMVDELFSGGGGQEGEIFQMATHIDSDQRIEIDRMRDLLAELPSG